MPTDRTVTGSSDDALSAAQSPSRAQDRGDGLLERVLAVAGAVFGRTVGPHDGFLALGGDSLIAVELSLRLEESLGVEPDFNDILFAADFAALAGSLAALLDGPGDRG